MRVEKKTKAFAYRIYSHFTNSVHKFTCKKGDVIFPELGHMSNSINCPFNSFELMEKSFVIDEKTHSQI